MRSRGELQAKPIATGAVGVRLLQRQRSCGGEGQACSECSKKKKVLQRSAADAQRPDAVPEIVHRTLRSPGAELDTSTRSFMESRFGHSFANVRVHSDATAAESARAVHANAYTVGSNVVFASGRYAPGTAVGKRLLAHELTHVVQQSGNQSEGTHIAMDSGGGSPQEKEAESAAQAIGSGASGLHTQPTRSHPQVSVQRQPTGKPDAPQSDEEKKDPAAPTPPTRPPQLTLDPAIQAQMFALQAQTLLDPANVRQSFLRLNPDSLIGAPAPPAWATLPGLPNPGDLVPRGAGPATPRPANAGDLLGGIMKIPAVDQALTTLQTDATAKVKSDWRSLSTGEKVATISGAVAIGGGALAGVLSNPEGRQFTLDVLQNRSLHTGVPGLKFQFNLTGPDQRVKFDLNLGQFLPRQWGFH